MNKRCVALLVLIAFVMSALLGCAPKTLAVGELQTERETYYKSGAYVKAASPTSTPEQLHEVLRPPLEDQYPKDPSKIIKPRPKADATVMVYFIGSDLESQHKAASNDLREMMNAGIGDNVNIIVQTGGAKQWYTAGVSSVNSQRFMVGNKSLTLIDDTLGKKNMTASKTLQDFIEYTVPRYPASRYFLVLWGHGGGTVSGMGTDENYPNDSLTLDEIRTALVKSGRYFDFIGFDACLMGSLETALMMSANTRYIIASEDNVPENGWEYSNWLKKLSDQPDIATTALGKIIVNDYIRESGSEPAILSLINAGNSVAVMNAFEAYFGDASNELLNAKYQSLTSGFGRALAAPARVQTYQHIYFDVETIARLKNGEASQNLIRKLGECVAYSAKTTAAMNNDSRGLSICLPYENKNVYTTLKKLLTAGGAGTSYITIMGKLAGQTTTKKKKEEPKTVEQQMLLASPSSLEVNFHGSMGGYYNNQFGTGSFPQQGLYHEELDTDNSSLTDYQILYGKK